MTDVVQNVQSVCELAHSVDCRGHVVGVCGQYVLFSGHLVPVVGHSVGCTGQLVLTELATHMVGVGGHCVTTCGQTVSLVWQIVGVPCRSAQMVTVVAVAQRVARAGQSVTVLGQNVS